MILSWNELLCTVLNSTLEGCDLAAFSAAVVLPQSCLLSPIPAHRPVTALAYGENEADNFAKCNLSATMPTHFSCLASLFFLINLFVTPTLHHFILSKNAAASFITDHPDGQTHISTPFLHKFAIYDQHCPLHPVLN